MKLETDKIIFAIGGIILGFGVVNILHTALGARSYAASPSDFSDLLANSPPPKRPVCPAGQRYNAAGKCAYPPITPAPGAPCVKGQVLRGGRCITAAAAKPANIAKAVNDLLGIPSTKTKKPRHETNTNSTNNGTFSAPTGGTGPSTGKGGTCSGKNCYKVIRNNACGCTAEPQKPLHCHSGGGGGADDVTIRTNCNNCNLDNYEATGILQFTGKCGCGGPEATIKTLGPAGHSKTNPGCCWEIATVTQEGKVGFNMEGPHPTTTKPKPEQVLGDVGSLVGKRVGIKSVTWKISGGYHHEIWVDPTGSGSNWTKYGERNVSSWGATKKVSQRPAAQQIEFRNDCAGAKWLYTEIAEIQPG